MSRVNVHEAKTHLSRLLQRVEAGEEIVIARAGRPVATLAPYRGPPARRRRGGQWHGRVTIRDGFDDLPEEIMSAFRGERP